MCGFFFFSERLNYLVKRIDKKDNRLRLFLRPSSLPRPSVPSVAEGGWADSCRTLGTRLKRSVVRNSSASLRRGVAPTQGRTGRTTGETAPSDPTTPLPSEPLRGTSGVRGRHPSPSTPSPPLPKGSHPGSASDTSPKLRKRLSFLPTPRHFRSGVCGPKEG